ncbi:glycosyltransferase family 2 protein [Cesiribacter sp. SM1]|uniref:glycosyltransferase family 2 protein n=1 Tax=Cesiribacter sp. SM1 TaxID=2861196 RepID=UPI001CD21403|nr:glycosyltransferase family 2 protein [Cesiribacter sp. SM1]
MEIKVSVVIPTYNRGDIISETLDSVAAQTMPEWECIVVDDGSTDETEAVLQKYISKDSRFSYVRRPAERCKGGNTCRNIGIEMAKGMYIQFLDSDDLIAANKFEEQLKALEPYDSHAVATCKWGRFRTRQDQLTSKAHEPTYISSNGPLKLLDVFGKHSIWFPPHVYLVRKSLLEEAGYWNEDLKMNQDGEFFARVLLSASHIVFVPSTEVYYRRHTGGNTSSWNKEEKVRSVIQSWELVDSAIEKKLGISNHSYVKQARNLIYDKIKNRFPAIVREHQDFFDKKRSKAEEFLIKANSRFQLMYLRKVKSKL